MTKPSGAPPVLITCLRCGREVDRWVSVLWQPERDGCGDVEIVSSEALAILCSECAGEVREAVRAAVDAATR
jgi:hypothetical protein